MEPKPDLKPDINADMKVVIERMLETSDKIIDLCDLIAETLSDDEEQIGLRTGIKGLFICRKNK